jgi:hypothetical protein
MNCRDSRGIVFRNAREARNILAPRAFTHGNMEWENVTATIEFNNILVSI